MKLVFLKPPIEDFYQTKIRLQPLGLAYLKAIVKKYFPQIKTKILDFQQGYPAKTIPYPKEVAYLKNYYFPTDKSPFSTFHHYYHFGADYEEIVSKVKEERPDLVLVSILFSPYYREALLCAQKIKEILKVPILAGGTHVSCAPLSVLKEEYIDFVIYGEGERPLTRFLEAYLGDKNFTQVPNLGFKEQGKPILTPPEPNFPLQDLPWPDFSDFSPANYTLRKKPIAFITCSRGCVYKCKFCSVKNTFPHYNLRPVEDVIAELKTRYQQGYRIFDFEDDNLSFNAKYFSHLLSALAKTFSGQDIECVAMNGLAYFNLDLKMLSLMQQAKFKELNLSLVTLNKNLAKDLSRPLDLKKLQEVITTAFKLGFKLIVYQILGLPKESLESIVKTMSFIAREPVLLGPSLYYAAPGSALFNPRRKDKDHFFMARSTFLDTEDALISRDELYSLFILARIINFLKGFKLAQHIHLKELLNYPVQNPRQNLGLTILSKLEKENLLSGYDGKNYFPIPHFSSNLWTFFKKESSYLTTLNNKKIFLGEKNV